MMFEGGFAASIHHKIAAINDRYAILRQGKNRQQVVLLEHQRKEEICRLNPKYGKGGGMME